MQQMMDGNIIIKRHDSQNYTTYFNQNTGLFIRKEDKGTKEPFWSEDGPELLDISITNYCENNCSFCYRHSDKNGKHISLRDFKNIIAQAEEAGVLQVALGGGNPNQHPQFIDILQSVRKHNIIPSYTTNGDGLTHEILNATADLCGAIALSYYPSKELALIKLLDKLKDYHIKINLHLILKSDTIDIAIEWLRNPPYFLEYINAIIFLNYKPINKKINLCIDDKLKIKTFFNLASECKHIKIGFDSCCISGIAQWMNTYPFLIESCEAARFSAFISEEMRMYPCSFMVNTSNFGDLNKYKLIDIWKKNKSFVEYRDLILDNSCNGCDFKHICNGGCRFMPEINFC